MISAATDNAAKTLCVQGDLTDEGAVEKLFAKAHEHFQRIDLLFNVSDGLRLHHSKHH
jgi:NAD(P)-dependent dehydrogenase (short-subunit alcohol dehydrogenase family)